MMNSRTPLLPNRIPKGLGIRHIQACLMFAAMIFAYFLRVNMSVAVVAMVNRGKNTNVDHYDWDPATRSLILSSFFWGYVVAQLPAGISAQRFGAKIVLILTSVVGSLLTIAIPWSASVGDWRFVVALRVLIGFCQGSVYPCVHTLLAKWAPRTERGFLATIVYSGAQIGTSIMLGISGVISDSSLGWPSLFYISGGLTIIWAVVYAIFGADSPEDTRFISKYERDYIENLTGATMNKHRSTPWASLFTSIPFIALIFAHCGFTWGFYTLLTEMPTYMSSALGMDMNSNAFLAAIPYLTMWILCLIVSPISDILINREILSVRASRKIFNSIGQWVPMISLIALGYITKENKDIAILLLSIAVGFNSASYVGYLVNHMDLSPNYAGTMMGITNGLSNLLSVFAPLVVGAIVKDEHDPAQWRIVFFITAGIYLFCNLVFVIFGKAAIQPWNYFETSSTVDIISEKKSNCDKIYF